MRIAKATNDWVELTTKGNDFAKMMQVAEKMQEDTQDGIVIIEACEDEKYITMSAVWNHYQAADWKDVYREAKKEVA